MWEDKRRSLMNPYAVVHLDGLLSQDEGGLVGVPVELYRVEDNELVDTTTTGPLGGYEFAGLPPDDYYVHFGKPTDDPDRWRYTLKNVGQSPGGPDPADDSDADREVDPHPGRSDPFTLEMGDELEDIDAGLFQLGLINGLIFQDVNENGMYENEPVGYPGRSVSLYDGNGNLLGSIVTDGGYHFDRLEILKPDGSPFEYYLVFDLPPDTFSTDGYYEVWDRYAFTAWNVGFPIYDSDPHPVTGVTQTFDLVDSDEVDGFIYSGIVHWQEWTTVGGGDGFAAPDFFALGGSSPPPPSGTVVTAVVPGAGSRPLPRLHYGESSSPTLQGGNLAAPVTVPGLRPDWFDDLPAIHSIEVL